MIFGRYGHKNLAGEFSFSENDLKLVRPRNISLKQFELISFSLLISSEKVFQSFIEVNSDLNMGASMCIDLSRFYTELYINRLYIIS